AFSYGKMVRVFPTAGSAYTYTRETMSPGLGFLVGWTSLMDYLLLPMVNCLIARLYMESLVPDAPAWVWVVLYTIIMTGIVTSSMRGTANFNAVLLIFAVTMVALFCVLAIVNLTNGEGSGLVFSAEPFVHEGDRLLPLHRRRCRDDVHERGEAHQHHAEGDHAHRRLRRRHLPHRQLLRSAAVPGQLAVHHRRRPAAGDRLPHRRTPLPGLLPGCGL